MRVSLIDQTHECSGPTHVRISRCSSSLYTPKRLNRFLFCHVMPPWAFPEHPLPTRGNSITILSQHHACGPSHSTPLYRKPESHPYPTVSGLEGPFESIPDDSEIHRGEGDCLESHRKVAARPGLVPRLVSSPVHTGPTTAVLSLLRALPALSPAPLLRRRAAWVRGSQWFRCSLLPSTL